MAPVPRTHPSSARFHRCCPRTSTHHPGHSTQSLPQVKPRAELPQPRWSLSLPLGEGGSQQNTRPGSHQEQTTQNGATKLSNLFGVLGLPAHFYIFQVCSYCGDQNGIKSTPLDQSSFCFSPNPVRQIRREAVFNQPQQQDP